MTPRSRRTALPVVVYTIGHSTRSADTFVALLGAHAVTRLADVRRFAGSRRQPQFARDALAASLAAAAIAYRHFPALGGFRRPRPDSANGGWRQAGFRGYADYMETPAFEQALGELLEWARGGPDEEDRTAADAPPPGRRPAGASRPRLAIMCAEALWWRCHRQLIADALVARRIEVRHIASADEAPVHTLTPFACIVSGRVQYPALV